MGRTNLLLSVVEILDVLNNSLQVNKRELSNYVSLDSEVVEDFIKFLENRKMINVHKHTGDLSINDEGRKFLKSIKTLIRSIT